MSIGICLLYILCVGDPLKIFDKSLTDDSKLYDCTFDDEEQSELWCVTCIQID